MTARTMRFCPLPSIATYRSDARKGTLMGLPNSLQMQLDLLPVEQAASPSPASNDDDDYEDDPLVAERVIKRWVDASTAERIHAKGPASVFDMAFRPVKIKLAKSDRPLYVVKRDGDKVRCVKIREQDTPEWIAKEAARRARQVLPKPPKQNFELHKAARGRAVV